MERQTGAEQLSQISTAWTALRQLHSGSGVAANEALQLLVERYRGAVYRYLLRALGDAAEAEYLTQDFFLGMLGGRFRHADPDRGRFRDYVRTSLFHEVSRSRRRRRKLPLTQTDLGPGWDAALAEGAEAERLFNEGWSDELLARAWDALRQARPAFHVVLRFRADHPEMSSAEMAEALQGQLGAGLTADTVRQTLHRARERFAELLLAEVAHSLEPATPEAVEEELRELGLLNYCQAALLRASARARS
ncbi:MAG: sigma-70 family RNA polymerase sigma factor [Gemmataceae bacterium]|nr:sigma-70 family RNA polymerase sigma factor [Gemmataceae bacterium]